MFENAILKSMICFRCMLQSVFEMPKVFLLLVTLIRLSDLNENYLINFENNFLWEISYSL